MENDVLGPLLLITALAAVIPIFSKWLDRFGIPIVVYEILAGIAIGVSGFNLIEPSPILNFLAEFGFAFLMFLSGLELDYQLLNPMSSGSGSQSRWKRPLPLGVLLFAGTVLLAFGASALLVPPGAANNPFLLGLILSTTSLGVVVPVLKEKNLTSSRFGQYVLAAASIADFATLLLLSTSIAIIRKGLTLDLLLVPTLLLIFILVARFSHLVSQGSAVQKVLNSLSSATSQLRVRAAFAFMVAWVLLAEAFGVEVILGAFLAGAIAGLVPEHEDSGEREKLDAIGYGFFIPIFFIMVGVQFNLQAVFTSTQGVLLLFWLLAVAFFVKVVPAFLLKLRFTWSQTLAGGFLLSSRLSLIIAASSIAFGMGLISETVNSDIILLALISVTVAPLLFNRIFPLEQRRERSGVIVVGEDQLAEYISERLMHSGESVTVICPDAQRLGQFQKLGVCVVEGCQDYGEALEKAGAVEARVLLDLTSSSEQTLELCRLGRRTYGIPLVVSRIADVELIPELQQLGVMVVQPELATAMALEGAIRYPTAFNVLVHQTENIDVTEVTVTNNRLKGKRLGEIRLPGDTLILSLQRDGFVMIPHSDTVLQTNDRLGLIGSPASLDDAAAMLKQ